MEYREVVKEFNRMCAYYKKRPEDCPLTAACGSDMWDDWLVWSAENIDEFQDIVINWSKEHPVVIYPTLRELITWMYGTGNFKLSEVLDMPIPDEAAEELGIIPINEGSLGSEWR